MSGVSGCFSDEHHWYCLEFGAGAVGVGTGCRAPGGDMRGGPAEAGSGGAQSPAGPVLPITEFEPRGGVTTTAWGAGCGAQW